MIWYTALASETGEGHGSAPVNVPPRRRKKGWADATIDDQRAPAPGLGTACRWLRRDDHGNNDGKHSRFHGHVSACDARGHTNGHTARRANPHVVRRRHVGQRPHAERDVLDWDRRILADSVYLHNRRHFDSGFFIFVVHNGNGTGADMIGPLGPTSCSKGTTNGTVTVAETPNGNLQSRYLEVTAHGVTWTLTVIA